MNKLLLYYTKDGWVKGKTKEPKDEWDLICDDCDFNSECVYCGALKGEPIRNLSEYKKCPLPDYKPEYDNMTAEEIARELSELKLGGCNVDKYYLEDNQDIEERR